MSLKTITVTASDGTKEQFTGQTIETKPAGGTLRVIIDGEHIASYKTWDRWNITEQTSNK